MDAQKIAERFQQRKNRTEKAMSDLQKIFDWVSETVDDVTFFITDTPIRLRGAYHSNYDNSLLSFGNPDDHDMRRFCLGIYCGTCCIVGRPGNDPISLDDINYINMSDVQGAIIRLFIELEDFSTREESTKKIAAIAAMVRE